MRRLLFMALLAATPGAQAQQVDAWHQQYAKCRYEATTWALEAGIDTVTSIGRLQGLQQRVTDCMEANGLSIVWPKEKKTP